ncbi:MAG: hypothetical protein ACI9DO_002825 [Reinekea sp.]|uniref:hypothetical protein n=1 Tax=Reinekea sp. TaxID=1970455 RepID=UPI00398A14E5
MFQFQFNQRPPWQRAIALVLSIVIVATLFWVGLVVVLGLAVFAIVMAVINKIKIAITGRPLFTPPQHFHRYQSQFKQSNVIEGEVVSKDTEPKD